MKEKRKKFFVSMDQFNAIQKILDTLHQKVGFDSVLLADHSGQLISRTGELSRSDAVSVTALAAGSFRANQEIAKVIGDSEFTHITQEGSGRRIYISCMDSRFFLISVFGEGIALGLVRIMQK
ncbi:MAG TPA: roadblock/LC7 domain-containing protein, partial [bacterium]|nr:roadblock/LC7 domain-containing protein [bacterium]